MQNLLKFATEFLTICHGMQERPYYLRIFTNIKLIFASHNKAWMWNKQLLYSVKSDTGFVKMLPTEPKSNPKPLRLLISKFRTESTIACLIVSEPYHFPFLPNSRLSTVSVHLTCLFILILIIFRN